MGREKYSGVTIHTGWYPQLLKSGTNPSRKFSSKRTGKGVKVKGFTSGFYNEVKRLTDEKPDSSLLSNFRMGALAGLSGVGVPGGGTLGTSILSYANYKEQQNMDSGGTTKKAKEFYRKAATFSLRGNHVWYMGRNEASGPVTIANEITNRNFSFKKADDWYMRKYGSARGMTSWAQKVLGLGEGVKPDIKPKEVLDFGRTAEEVVLKDNPYGMVKPKSPKGMAQARDIESSFGQIESTESTGLGHGLVKGKPGKGATEAEWTDYMKNKVIVAWNKYTAKVLEQEKGSIKKAEKYIVETSSKKANKEIRVSGINKAASQKMRHEVSLSLVRNHARNNMMTWREGIPVGPRDKETGQRTYASTTVDYNKNNMKFIHKRTLFVSGVNHMAGIANEEMQSKNFSTRDHYINQQNHFMHQAANNEGTVRTINGRTFQSINKAANGINHSTNVSFSPKAAKEWIYTLGDMIDKELKGSILKRTKKIQAAVDKKKKKMKDNGQMFWALPYIGVEEGLFIQK